MTATPVYNIVDSEINTDNYNIVYQNHNSAFDLILKTLDYNFCDTEISDIGLNTNLWISNDPIDFSQKSIHLSNDAHVNSILFFHSVPPNQFKKEDVLILKQHIQKKYKILCSTNFAPYWLPSDNKWQTIDYGIPNLISQTTNKNYNLVILNFNNNNTINSLCSSIQKNIPKTLMLNAMPNSIDELYSVLQDSHICLDFENIINSLVASVCECFIISPYSNPNLKYYAKIDNMDNLQNIVQSSLNNIDIDKIVEQKEIILDQFPFDIFAQRVSVLFNSIIKEKFIL